ncbi:unnamed protein product [Nippostrongylus brasiliensis]|uniref:CAAX prenyl protease 2 n=1 Tax=Nippostrongylus brasiliensis TaxID=27835 RepID=A0A0N4YK57_NIPBR|nr:unnamed protein product [Nippostrongylus brasiliensis]
MLEESEAYQNEGREEGGMGCGASISLAVLFPLSFVGFLHLADHNGTDRNDPQSIRKRSIAAIANNVLCVTVTYAALWQRGDSSPLRSMGLRTEGALSAILWPSVLVSVLYTGQWVLLYLDAPFEWRAAFQKYTFIRDVILGPVTEEITFRCCCVALLSNCLSPTMTIVVAPLPFACSHLHHIGDDRRRVFQMAYTYVFGTYVTYLFQSTKQALAPVITHAICNCLGLPLFGEIDTFPSQFHRVLLWTAYASGMYCFVMLLGPLTQPELYQNW